MEPSQHASCVPRAKPSRPAPAARDRQRRAYILEAARAIVIAHGRLRITLKDIAIATGLTQTAIRKQVGDLDHLFAVTLTKYLDEILKAVAAVPLHHADLFARRRAEYLRVTRGICNVPTPLHFLWMRERFTLPDDELEPLEQARRMLSFLLAGEDWETALLLLDSHHVDADQIEAMLAAGARTVEPEAPAEDKQPKATPSPHYEMPATPEPTAAPATRPLSWLAAQPPPAHAA